MSQKITPANSAELEALRAPVALVALEALKKSGWLETDVQSLDKFFAAEPGHPAKVLLADAARNGGKLAVIQLGVLAAFTAAAIALSSVNHTLTPVVFTLWGSIGVCAGLLAAKYPGRFTKKRK